MHVLVTLERRDLLYSQPQQLPTSNDVGKLFHLDDQVIAQGALGT